MDVVLRLLCLPVIFVGFGEGVYVPDRELLAAQPHQALGSQEDDEVMQDNE